MANIGTLTAHIGANTRGLNTGLAQAQGRISGFSAGAMKSIAKLSGAFAALGLAVGGLALFKNTTKTGIDFEQTMTTVAGVMRATAKESKALTAAARKMGETTEWSASEAGGALQFLGMAGFEANKAIKALPGTLDLATAGQIGLGRAADIATNALTAMGLEVEELERVNDVFVGTITRSNTNMEMMAESFKYAAPVARAYGYTVEELSGLIGMLGNAGIQGTMAGTQLAMAIQQTNKVAKKFGVEGGKFVDVLEQLRKKGYASTEVMTAFGMRAGRAAGVLYEATDAAKEFQGTLANVSGEAGRLADKMRSTVGASFKELKSVIESLALDVFETYRDELKNLVVDTTKWIRENKDNIVAFAEGIKVAFTGIIRLLNDLGLGFADFFETVNKEAKSTFFTIEEWEERMREGLRPPELTPWEKFWASFKSVWMDVGEALFFGLRAIETLIVGLINNAIELLGVLKKISDLDFKGAWEAITSLETPERTFEAWGNAWNDMVGNLAPIKPKIEIEPTALDPWGKAFVEMLKSDVGPAMITITAEEYAAAVAARKKREALLGGGAGGGEVISPEFTEAYQSWSDYTDYIKGWIAEFKEIQENKYQWLYAHEQISTDEYLAFLEQKLSREMAYSDAWVAIQQRIEGVKDMATEADNARWQAQIAAQEEALDMLLVGYDTFWQSLLDIDMTGAERRKAIFESIAWAFMDYSAQMTRNWIKNALLQKTVTEGAEKSKLAAVATGATGRMAWAVKEGAVAIATAAKSIYSAVAKIFEAHAWIPFAGVAIAAGFVGAMMATMGAFKKFATGGLIGGARWPKDSVPIMATGGEYMMPQPAVASIGLPALEYMNKTGRIPAGGNIYIDMGGFTFNRMKKEDAYLIEGFVEDKLVEVLEEKLKNRELTL